LVVLWLATLAPSKAFLVGPMFPLERYAIALPLGSPQRMPATPHGAVRMRTPQPRQSACAGLARRDSERTNRQVRT